jgi:hypothetical protein
LTGSSLIKNPHSFALYPLDGIHSEVVKTLVFQVTTVKPQFYTFY